MKPIRKALAAVTFFAAFNFASFHSSAQPPNTDSSSTMCLAEAKDSAAPIKTHKEAHGLVPAAVFKVKTGK
jgi:hypothetical protein